MPSAVRAWTTEAPETDNEPAEAAPEIVAEARVEAPADKVDWKLAAPLTARVSLKVAAPVAPKVPPMLALPLIAAEAADTAWAETA